MGLCRQCDLLSHIVTYCVPVSYIVGLGHTLWGYVVFLFARENLGQGGLQILQGCDVEVDGGGLTRTVQGAKLDACARPVDD